MEVEIVINGGVTLILIPKGDMEEKLLEQLATQPNEVVVIKNGTRILNKTIPIGVIIGKKGNNATDGQ